VTLSDRVALTADLTVRYLGLGLKGGFNSDSA
jgi:hypothetical protein